MSRNSRRIITILCLLTMTLVVWFDRSYPRHSRHWGTPSQKQSAAADLERYNGKTFSVAKVVDGDTIDIDVPDGRHSHTRIRLLGVDTPETKKPETPVMYFGPEATEFTQKSVLGKQVIVFLDAKQNRDKYGRLLAYVQLPDGRFLNELLLSEGFAYAERQFPHDLYHKYKQLEASARRAKKGLWLKVTREQFPQWLQREDPNLLKK